MKTTHIGINTDNNRSVDKATQTDPLIILEPTTIEKLTNGFKLISFNDIPKIFVSTAQSFIKPIVHKFQPKYTPTPISSTKRTEHESVKINKVIKETIEKTQTQTRDHLANLKVAKPVTKPNLDTIVKRYYPRLKDQLNGKKKQTRVKWLAFTQPQSRIVGQHWVLKSVNSVLSPAFGNRYRGSFQLCVARWVFVVT